MFGINPRTMGLGGAHAGVADDLGALYSNPAGLVQLSGMTLATGMLVGVPWLSEDGVDLGMPQESSYFVHVGLPLSGKLKDLLALGVSLNLPWGKLLGARLYQKHEPYFALHDDSVQLLSFRAGAAARVPWKPLSFLTLGGAIQVLGSVVGTIGFYAPFQRGGTQGPTNLDSRLEAWADIDVPTATFYTVGAMALLGEGERLRVGVTYHSPQSILVKFPITITTRLGISEEYQPRIPVDAVARITTKFHPQQVNVGASYRWGRLLLSAELTWIDYSSYEIPYAAVSLDLEKLKRDPDLRLLLGPDSELLDPLQPRVDWNDAVVPRLGAEYQLLSWLTVRGGYFFERSPLGSTDFPVYDCDKHGMALSARASFLRPWELLPGWLHVDLSVQELLYVQRHILGSDVGGQVFAVAAGLEVSFL
jgi:hypothetical protein